MKAGEPQQAAENKGAEGRRASRGGERGKSSEGGMEAEGEEREARDALRHGRGTPALPPPSRALETHPKGKRQGGGFCQSQR